MPDQRTRPPTLPAIINEMERLYTKSNKEFRIWLETDPKPEVIAIAEHRLLCQDAALAMLRGINGCISAM